MIRQFDNLNIEFLREELFSSFLGQYKTLAREYTIYYIESAEPIFFRSIALVRVMVMARRFAIYGLVQAFWSKKRKNHFQVQYNFIS